MNTSLVERNLLNSLKADPEYRHAWNLENVYTGVCFQIRALREQRNWSQDALGKASKMAQERISILEDPNAETKPTLKTLLRVADAFDVGLDVRFVPYRTVIDRSIKTDMKDLEVPSFSEELPELERSISQKSSWASSLHATSRAAIDRNMDATKHIAEDAGLAGCTSLASLLEPVMSDNTFGYSTTYFASKVESSTCLQMEASTRSADVICIDEFRIRMLSDREMNGKVG